MPSTQMFSRIGAALILAASSANAAYTLNQLYDHTNFFSEFSFFSDPDPTHGLVAYQNASAANKTALAGYTNNYGVDSVYLGVDHTTVLSGNAGRASTRVTSNKAYNHGLFIADVAHMPEGCGTWPALWSFGADWPTRGEMDIIEGVNGATTNQMTLHTSEGCIMSNNGSAAGTTLIGTDCNASNGNTGCGQTVKNTATYGPGFNAAGGGVYAWEWTSSHIAIYFFPRTAIPENIQFGRPDPKKWGTPMAMFSGSGCDIDTHFKDHNIVLDTTFCGDWAGSSVWSSGGCAASTKTATCAAYVSANPTAFKNAYWIINSIKVFSS